MKLHQKRCVPCEGVVSPMKGALLKTYMNQISGWTLSGSKKITKEYRFKNDKDALNFLNKTGMASVKEGHHPVTTWIYNKITIEFWTHAIGGLSKNDFIMAAKYDRIYEKMKTR